MSPKVNQLLLAMKDLSMPEKLEIAQKLLEDIRNQTTESSRQESESSFIDVALSLQLEGPADWSENIDRYLYGDLVRNE